MRKLYYSIGEISEIIDEEQYILRYWEKEFDELKPKKNRSGNRIYSEKDLFVLKTIKKLLRDDKLSLKGAKEHLKKLKLEDLGIEDLFSGKMMEEQGYFENGFRDDSGFIPSGKTLIDKNDLIELKSILSGVLNLIKD